MDDIFVYVTRSSIQYVLSVLNSFYDDIKLTYEQGNNNGQPDSLIISFLDVLFIRDNKKISTTVFRTDTHTHTHTHWESFSPVRWKRRTPKSLSGRAYWIFFNQSLLEKELEHLKNVCHKQMAALC